MSEDIKKKKRSKGFTLIEILVAVLIVGILAAVAVPTYQKAVEKSKTTAPLSNLGAIAKAQKVKKLESLHYTDKVEELDISLPDEATGEKATGSTFEGKDFTYTVYGDDEEAAIAKRKNVDEDKEYTLSVDYATGELFCSPEGHPICLGLGLAVGQDYTPNEDDSLVDCSSDMNAFKNLLRRTRFKDYPEEMVEFELDYMASEAASRYCKMSDNMYKECNEWDCMVTNEDSNGCIISAICDSDTEIGKCQGSYYNVEAGCGGQTWNDGQHTYYLNRSCLDKNTETLECDDVKTSLTYTVSLGSRKELTKECSNLNLETLECSEWINSIYSYYTSGSAIGGGVPNRCSYENISESNGVYSCTVFDQYNSADVYCNNSIGCWRGRTLCGPSDMNETHTGCA